MYRLKGGKVRAKPKAVVNDYIVIPQELKDTHQNIDLCVNIMYIKGQMFLVTVPNKVKSIMIQEITDMNITILNKSFDNTFRVYNEKGL